MIYGLVAPATTSKLADRSPVNNNCASHSRLSVRLEGLFVELELRNSSHWRFAFKIHLKCLNCRFAVGIGDHHAEPPCAFGVDIVVENEFPPSASADTSTWPFGM